MKIGQSLLPSVSFRARERERERERGREREREREEAGDVARSIRFIAIRRGKFFCSEGCQAVPACPSGKSRPNAIQSFMKRRREEDGRVTA